MLTTLYLYRQWSGSTDTGNDDRTEAAIAAASSVIYQYLGRTIQLATYARWLDGSGARWLMLPEWPIRAVYGVSLAGADALTVSATGYPHAVVQVTDTGVILAHVVAGALIENTITFASQPTLTELAAAINAVSGWTATVKSGYGDNPASHLRREVTSCASPDEAVLQVPEIPFSPVDIMSDTDRVIRLRGDSSRFDVAGCPSLSPDGENVFPPGRSNVFVWWKAGYTEPEDAVGHESLSVVGDLPADLTMVCNATVKSILEDPTIASGVQSESIGNYSYTLGAQAGVTATIHDRYAAVLTPYRRML